MKSQWHVKASNDGLLSNNSGLLWGIVTYYAGLLGFPGANLKSSL